MEGAPYSHSIYSSMGYFAASSAITLGGGAGHDKWPDSGIELRPVSCAPLTRDKHVPANIGLNDALGNYSLTLIDSLSTLAILASSSSLQGKNTALGDFQEGVALLVDNYGDGTEGPSGVGLRARGFDIDSKVQVFETVIRGVGGLLSAHLFAIGELPIRGYDPKNLARDGAMSPQSREIIWPSGFVYNGQLLRLAHDLATRLLPAFYTPTGIPYPRVNLRLGIPFYVNSILHEHTRQGQCGATQKDTPEIVETCSAGAGSLVLEFATLSRLTGDGRFEELAKRAFWAVWNRRSSIGLVGNGLDPESGLWVGPVTGIGAGVDSFFEYALKSHILLSGLGTPNDTRPPYWEAQPLDIDDPNLQFSPLTREEHSADSFLTTWRDAHAAIKRHLYNDHHHPHYVNVHVSTGAPQTFWIDSLGAYFPGLLTLGGELDEAIETSLLYTALWTRYSALPERWSTRDGGVEGGLGWWPGRPEFIESTYHLHRATQDPWYLHVGEMVLRDVKRRCWTNCGLSGIQDVRSGELSDRMESFFLGETAKYLFLLFDPDHPINSLDAPFVFTTEGHPLVIPRGSRPERHPQAERGDSSEPGYHRTETCPLPPPNVPFSFSATAARDDIFHAASLTRLHLIPNINTINSPLVEHTKDHPSVSLSDLQSPTNYTFYPWTLPPSLIPQNGISSKITSRAVFELQFPIQLGSPQNARFGGGVYRATDGIVIKSLDGVRIGLIRDQPRYVDGVGDVVALDDYRINRVSGIALGRDEKVYIAKDLIGDSADPNFMLVRDSAMIDLVFDIPPHPPPQNGDPDPRHDFSPDESLHTPSSIQFDPEDSTSDLKTKLNHLINHLSSLLNSADSLLNTPYSGNPNTEIPAEPSPPTAYHLPALSSAGLGAAPLPAIPDFPPLPWTTLFFATESCTGILPEAATTSQILVLKRGGCSFSRKLSTIPSFTPGPNSLQLVIVVSYPEHEIQQQHQNLIQPLLETPQYTPRGLIRHNPIPLVLVSGGQNTYELLEGAQNIGFRRRWNIHVQGIPVANLGVV
ncbi:hypothetical protein FGG08_006559 [Glutinoglossum americanum]|uniref:alpha-1,2-Mannosidase n=1 Tax=Glutinoglossum americanum TaxID=1670608 RepID=A0A9P8L1S6_9PEZI|nr:hypothetical protein FGG08_006559 [Glutinoglossum americanum]